MAAFKDLLTASPNNLGSSQAYFIDGDTIRQEDGSLGRIQGIDMPEVQKFFARNGVPQIKQGTAGGDEATKAIANLANRFGYTNVRKLGRDVTGDRDLIDLTNDKGESFRTRLLRAGISEITPYTSNEDALAAQLARSARETKQLEGELVNDTWEQVRVGLEQVAAGEGERQRGFRKVARNEAELAQLASYYKSRGIDPSNILNTSRVQVRDTTRDFDNQSNTPFNDAWDTAWESVAESGFGFAAWSGDATGIDAISEWGEAGIERARGRLEQRPGLTTSYQDVNGIWGNDGAVQYVLNNAIMSVPYMAAISASALATPIAGVTSVVGLAATGIALSPAALYTGQVYAEQEGDNKNVAVAGMAGLSQAVLDRLGLGLVLKGGNLATKETRQKAIQNLMKSGLSKTEADQALLAATKAELAGYAGNAAQIAKDQLNARNLGRAMLARAFVGGSGEAVTEGLQEAIAYTASHHANGFRDWDANQFNERVANGIVAGGSLGSAIAVPGSVFEYGQWADVAYRKGEVAEKEKAESARATEEERLKPENGAVYRNGKLIKKGYQPNVQDFTAQATEPAKKAKKKRDKDGGPTLSTRSEAHKKTRQDENFKQWLGTMWTELPGIVKGQVSHIVSPKVRQASRTAWKWMEANGGGINRIMSGSGFEDWKWHKFAEYRNSIPAVATIVHQLLGTQARPHSLIDSKDELLASQKLEDGFAEAQANAVAAGRGEFELKAEDFSDPKVADLVLNKIQKLSDDLYSDQKKYNPTLGYIPYFLMRSKTFNKGKIEAQKAEFSRLLQDEYNIPREQADKLTEAIINQSEVNDIDDAFSVTSDKRFVPGAHKQRSLNLSDNDKFLPFFEESLFRNISNNTKAAVRYQAIEEFIGSNNEKTEYWLDTIEQELKDSGWTDEQAAAEVNRMAALIKDFYDVESGNYKRIQNETLRAVQNFFMVFTAVTSLPFSVLSNSVELAMIGKGIPSHMLFGKHGVKAYAENFGGTLWDTMTKGPDRREGPAAAARRRGADSGYGVAQDLGLFEWEVGAAHTTGVVDASSMSRRILDSFFRLNGLQGWTNMARATRAAMAWDYIMHHVDVIKNSSNEFESGEAYKSREALRNLGVDPDFVLEYRNTPGLDEDIQQRFDDMMREGQFNFVNEAIALPKAGNRPKLFQDPRFALFTQFQGFISTFTANHIPRMWGEYIKRGSPAMRFHAFSLIMTMIMMGFLSQWLKDQLKYGEQSPYLDTSEVIRRGVASSGWLGTSERLIDFAFPIYEDRYYNPVDWAIGTIAGESAAISKAARIGGLAGGAFDPEDPTTLEDVTKLSPFTQWAHRALAPTFSFK